MSMLAIASPAATTTATARLVEHINALAARYQAAGEVMPMALRLLWPCLLDAAAVCDEVYSQEMLGHLTTICEEIAYQQQQKGETI